MRKKIIILGATGSIGQGTLDVIRQNKNYFEITALSAHLREDDLLLAAEEFGVSNLVLSGIKSENPKINYSGTNSISKMLKETEADIVVNAVAGSDGLIPSVVSLQTGKDLALANKETIVMAGRLILDLAEKMNRKIIPVDSEHSAIFHLLENRDPSTVNEIILTASGGPFRTKPLQEFEGITLEDALKHPTWEMGKKISIDSATMANKGLEVIEAHVLFSINPDRIKVLIHPESRVHSLIRTMDSSMFAQISDPDMRVPIGNALFYPEQFHTAFGSLNLADTNLTFFKVDFMRYPLLELAFTAIKKGGSYPLAYNAANEIAVDYFMQGRIGFNDISDTVLSVLENEWTSISDSFEKVLETDLTVRENTIRYIEKSNRN
ncbi:MAG: 1-deoxy-D-xylulose-5-phosphate reductoisomerase [Spirochaetales bacterium]|nr:1-deoxy-D-xylulose-5-phosphate reductoisomerase [Spirochaetales bacterium]